MPPSRRAIFHFVNTKYPFTSPFGQPGFLAYCTAIPLPVTNIISNAIVISHGKTVNGSSHTETVSGAARGAADAGAYREYTPPNPIVCAGGDHGRSTCRGKNIVSAECAGERKRLPGCDCREAQRGQIYAVQPPGEAQQGHRDPDRRYHA